MKLVARQLGISPRTVAFHKYRAMNLLGLHGNKELMEFAIRSGLLGEVHEPNPTEHRGRVSRRRGGANSPHAETGVPAG